MQDFDAKWITNKDFVPKAGEPCLDTDTGIVKYGDGVTTYENLPESGASATHYEGVKADGETDNEVITRVLTAASASFFTSSNADESNFFQYKKSKSRFIPDGTLSAYKHASIGIVPVPQNTSASGRDGFHTESCTIALAKVSFKGASPTSAR